ncbi:phosphotransferase [Actinopolymorpha sp. B17G11]|uniref:phosphotransferase n=1 Tax=Actinopolymorpha sp. B17G11 TaxID=3160861 RepID=UPI0032E4E93B
MSSLPGTNPSAAPTRAAGVRISFDEVPAPVRRWVERELGSPVVSASTQSGGFSPGAAARLVTADGRRGFVKAVGGALNPDSPGLLRRERTTMEAVPALPWTPRMRSAYDDGDWIALLFDDIEGREPAHPWTAEDTDLVFGALADLTAALTPTPWPEAPDLSDAGIFRGGWAVLQESPPADLDPWAVARLDLLREYQQRARAAVVGESLVHWDIRADNVLITGTGVVFVDWAWAARGARWVDTALAALDLVISGSSVDVDDLLSRHPCTRDADPLDVTALLATVTGALTERSRAPVPPGLPTIRDYQRVVADALTAWIRRRMS